MLGILLSLVKARRGASFFQPLEYWWQVGRLGPKIRVWRRGCSVDLCVTTPRI
jgi:hypothetical protein